MTDEREYRIRKYRSDDRGAVRRICYQTGYMGEHVGFLYGDAESFADMFTSYYTDREPETAWVLERADDETVVGYLLGCMDSREAWAPQWIALRHLFLRGLLFRRGTALFFLRVIWDLIRHLGRRRTPVDLERYPAHLHLDLIPDARGGWGIYMHQRFLTHLRRAGIPGVHGEMIAENRFAIAVAKRLGYRLLGAPYPLPGMRGKNGEQLHGQAIVMDLSPRAERVNAMAPRADALGPAPDREAAVGGAA